MTIYTPKNPIVWVDTLPEIEAAAAEIDQHDVIGLDCETLPDFLTLCLLQISTPEANYLIDPLALPNLDPLVDILETDRPLKVIHSAPFERRVLAGVGFGLRGVFDTHAESKRRRGGASGNSLAEVAARELGITIDKEEAVSDWRRRPLTPRQLTYAAVDVEILLPLHSHFTAL